jgi:AcrR family transcriptional regulator
VRVRDARATRQRLIDAARAEFAEFGIAGGRVDRIARNAESNKAQIYHYYGSKDGMFDAVWEAIVTQIVDEAPIDVEDLPGYAARLAEGYATHPDLTRIITWQRLERSDDPPHAFAVKSTKSKVDAIAAAQAQGVVPDHFDASVLLALILHIAALWGMSSPDVLAVVDLNDHDRPSHTVKEAVARLLTSTSA